MGKATTVPLKQPKSVTVAPTPAGSTLVPPIELIRVFSADQWEDFTLEWAHSLKDRYERVERCGGAGDMGRDVVADVSSEEWHNFQCKHYGSPLSPSAIILELGKLCYYTHTRAYSCPTKYFFVAPQGVGTTLKGLLKKPDELRQRLISDWSAKCEKKITSKKTIPLNGSLLAHVNGFDFSIVDYVPPLDLLEQHRTTPWHAARFPGGLPERPTAVVPPVDEETYESRYIQQLLEAYGDHLGTEVDVESLESRLRRHLLRSREWFFHAEALRNFSRDNLPPEQFERLQDEFYAAVIDTVDDPSHEDGFVRVVETTKRAQMIDPTNNALRDVLGMADRGGICHQLAEEDRVKWVPK